MSPNARLRFSMNTPNIGLTHSIPRTILVTGATGYIGGRLIPLLLELGHRVRVLVRENDSTKGRPWEHDVDVIRGDLLKPETLTGLCDDIDAAYYLVHSMYAGPEFKQHDRDAAQNFLNTIPKDQPTPHIIYLGGIQPNLNNTTPPSGRGQGEGPHAESEEQSDEGSGNQNPPLKNSAHLSSRAEVGQILANRLPNHTTEFRAGPIIGSGSASFEMVRYLTERLPLMITPSWVNSKVQPIAIRDVLAYLIAALDTGPVGITDIGTDPLTFKQMMLGVAAQRNLTRVILPTPFLAPKLAAKWVGAVTPIPNKLAVPLIEGVIHDLLADTEKARQLFPQVEPIGYPEAVRLALGKIERGEVETRWSGATIEDEVTTIIEDREGLARDQRVIVTDVPAEAMFQTVCSIGGERGWYKFQWAWWLRGLADAMLGGPGLRRSRRHPTELLEGEALDWWRVDAIEPYTPRIANQPDAGGKALIRLRAEMRVPGKAWLQWEIESRPPTTPHSRQDNDNTPPPTSAHAESEAQRAEGSGINSENNNLETRLTQTALFEPRGLPGTLYWYAMLPAHHFIFPGMLKAMEQDARNKTQH